MNRGGTYTTVVVVEATAAIEDCRGEQQLRGPWHNPLLLYYLTTDAIYIYSYGCIIGTADGRYNRGPFIGCHRVEAVRQIEISTGNSRHALRTIWPDDWSIGLYIIIAMVTLYRHYYGGQFSGAWLVRKEERMSSRNLIDFRLKFISVLTYAVW